jgi:hypothetical protein
VTKSRKVTKLVTLDFGLVKPCWEEFNLDLKKIRNLIMNDKFKNFGKIVKNGYGPIIHN